MHDQEGFSPRRWTTSSRYYSLRVQQNLFGTWELLKVWGSMYSRHGRHQVLPAENRDQALQLLESEAIRRIKRGYRVV